MKIYFCDECNESIPLQDIRDNVAATLKGKIFCKKCNPLKEVQTHKLHFASTALTQILLFVVAILLVVVIGLMLFFPRGQDDLYVTHEDMTQSVNQIEGRFQTLLDSDLSQEINALRDDLKAQEAKLEKIDTEMMAIRGDLLGLGSENENMQKNFQAVTNVREKLDRFLLKQDEFSASLEAFNSDSLRIRNRVAELGLQVDRLAEAFKAGIMMAQDVSGADDSSPNTESALLLAVRKKLESKDTGERFDGVYEILDNRIKEALPFVLPLIEDPDQFVQVGAIETVGEFLYLEALPTLVKVLRDPDVTVRAESLRQLIRMTGQNDLEFDVRDSEPEREKAVKKWEKWLKNRK